MIELRTFQNYLDLEKFSYIAEFRNFHDKSTLRNFSNHF